MRKVQAVTAAVLVAGLLTAAGMAWRVWRERQTAAVVRAAVPPLPDLSAWPEEFACRVRAATAAANRLDQPFPALTELACLYHANGLYREAQQVERGLRALEPGNAQWSYYLADTCQNLGDMEGTRTFLEESLRLAPHYRLTRLKLADLLLKLGFTDEARVQYEWRLAQVPQDPYALLGLARIALQRGDREEAQRRFETIVRTSPAFPPAHSLLAELYEESGDAVHAAEQRRLGSAAGRFIEANDPLLYKVYAWSFDPYRLDVQGGRSLQAGQWEASLPFYRRATRRAPADGQAHEALGFLYLQLDRPAEARAAFEAGVAAAPQTPSLYLALAGLLRGQKRPADALAVLQRGVRALPAAPNLRAALGTALEAVGRPAEAVAAYREAVRLDPDAADAQLGLGRCLLALGGETEAQTWLARALVRRPAGADDVAALAQQQLDAGQVERAAACIRALIDFNPAQPAARLLLERGLAAARKAGNQELVQAFAALAARLPPP